ncbi:MAG: hypothetical protein KDD58_06185 [Bdellovibrionales bacterium]|nr:hypothetical protein [Bdellovibrionales bacterium]
MNLKKLIIIIFSLSFIVSCGEESGKRTPIKREGKNHAAGGGSSGGISTKAVSAPGDNNKKCLDIYDFIQQVKDKGRANFRAYTSDLRVLEKTEPLLSNITTNTSIKWAQKNLVIETAKEKPDSFIYTGFAEDIGENVPSELAPFKFFAKKQQGCQKIDAQLFDDTQLNSYTIDANNSNEFQLTLLSLDLTEMYVFTAYGSEKSKDRLVFQAFRPEQERTVCDNSDTQTVLTKSIIVYEWNYQRDKKLEMTTVLANTFKDIIDGDLKDPKNKGKSNKSKMPIDLSEDLSKVDNLDSTRLNIYKDDYQRVLNVIRKSNISAECRK